ncbi:MAG: hypothetical protein LUO93_09580 [Methanomicrobiales archaeon]|nr:hypothetical protein [Methanomicrobiales archaeon]
MPPEGWREERDEFNARWYVYYIDLGAWGITVKLDAVLCDTTADISRLTKYAIDTVLKRR